jgi:cell division septation protein DedD
MTQDDIPAPACTGEEVSAPESAPTLPPAPVNPGPNLTLDAAAPDPFVVGVRVLRMAPAWLLAMTVGCSTLVLLLGWMNAGGAATVVAQPSALNDARSSRVAPASTPARPADAHQPEATTPASVPGGAAPAANNEPAAAATQPAAPAPASAAVKESDAPAAPPKENEKAQAESPAAGDDAGARFTVQVGSFSNRSEANERVSGLRAAGLDSRAVAVEIQGRGTWYRVRVGRFAERGEASKTLASVRAKGSAGAIIVPLQN